MSRNTCRKNMFASLEDKEDTSPPVVSSPVVSSFVFAPPTNSHQVTSTKTKPCNNFIKNGSCSRGNNFTFANYLE